MTPPMPEPREKVTCHAPHPDPRKKGEACGSFLTYLPAGVEFVTTADQAPRAPDGSYWLACPRRNCGKWNRFSLPRPAQAA
jgi:hypothetical protein